MSVLRPETKTVDFDLASMRVAVLEFGGTVQLCFLRDGWQGGPRAVMANVFVSRATPGQLRAIADHLDTLPLEGAA